MLGQLLKWLHSQKPTPPKQLTDPSVCKHPEWSSRYDHKSFPGAVAFRESRCLGCGARETGSGQ